MIKTIRLKDGLEVEVEVNESEAYEISDNSIVESSLDKIQDMLHKVISPISSTCNELSKGVNIDSTKVTIGVKVGVEGNFILAKSSGEANIQVEMTFNTKEL